MISSLATTVQSLLFFFFFPFFFIRPRLQHTEAPGLGSNWSHSWELRHSHQQHRIQSTSATCAVACSNTGYLTHWARPGITPASSRRQHWVLNPLSLSENFSAHFLFFLFSPFFYYYFLHFIPWFTMFCQFLLYNKVIQFYIYIYIYIYTYILFLALSSIIFHHKWLDIVHCAIQQDLIAYPLHMQ